MLRALRQTTRLTRLGLYQARWNSTTTPIQPPLMTKLKTDLKTAMRAKDTDRLNVIRALISEYNNSQKTNAPISTDVHLLRLIQKRAAASKDSARQFLEASRPDLKEQEDKAQAILEEYGSQVEVMSTEEVTEIVKKEVAMLKEAGKRLNPGVVFQSLFTSEVGALTGKPVDRSELVSIVKAAIDAA
ncbi:hypothetical protein BDV06DRAFT_185195 [Aspergillus oleicola]